MNSSVATPVDVKLMNTTAAVLFMAFAGLVVMAAGRWVARLPVFELQGVSVSGDLEHNNAATLRVNVASRLKGTFFTIDLARVRAAFEAVPWVRRAVVRREFPNRISVVLQEHQAVAYWEDEESLRLMNSFGEVFEANVGEVEQDSLPRLSGPDGQGVEVLAMYRDLAPQFQAMGFVLEQLELTGRGSWRGETDSGASVEFGRGSVGDVDARVQRFLKTLTQVTSRYGRQLQAVESADLRHENGYAIKLQGVTTLAADEKRK